MKSRVFRRLSIFGSIWKKATEIVKIVEPLVKVLWLVDGKKLAMFYVYEAMDQAKDQIRAAY
jgi:hypothetical protein